MEAKAVAKYVRVSPRKARVVIDQVRGKDVVRAREILRFSERAIAETIEKVLNSAVANAENNHGMSTDNLVVKAAFVDEGPTFKRIRPRAKGSAARIRKRTSHITIIVAPKEAWVRKLCPPASVSASPRIGVAVGIPTRTTRRTSLTTWRFASSWTSISPRLLLLRSRSSALATR